MINTRYLIKKTKRIRGAVMAIAVAVTSVIAAGSVYVQAEPAEETVDLDGTYHASLGLRTETKNIYRMAYYHKKSAGSDKWKHLAIGDYSSAEYQRIESSFTDAVIKGNGKYTVKLENADFQGETNFIKMQVSTDIPNTGQITFSDMVVKVNGTEVGRFEEPYIDGHEDANGNCCLLIINNERTGFQGIAGNIVPAEMENKITVSFKVSGFNYKKGKKPKPEVTSTPVPAKKKDNKDKKKNTPAPVKDKSTRPPVTATPSPVPDGSRIVVDEEMRPVVIISVIAMAVISIVSITLSVTKRKK
ncbi:MAG TPA: hypothetical protein DCZ23_09025 [Lachnospiraceae bacterium]|nr:hypothetical protein [Lachnospiraceae bacterium]